MKYKLFNFQCTFLTQVYFAGLIKKPLVSTPRSYENVGRPKKDFGQFEEMCRSTKHTAALELKSVAKSSKLLLYSAKLAMDDNGDKAASKVLNELYTDPCGNSAELLLSNSNPKQGRVAYLHVSFLYSNFVPFSIQI